MQYLEIFFLVVKMGALLTSGEQRPGRLLKTHNAQASAPTSEDDLDQDVNSVDAEKLLYRNKINIQHSVFIFP